MVVFESQQSLDKRSELGWFKKITPEIMAAFPELLSFFEMANVSSSFLQNILNFLNYKGGNSLTCSTGLYQNHYILSPLP